MIELKLANRHQLATTSTQIQIRPLHSFAEFKQVLDLRYRGYGHFATPAQALDALDMAEHSLILVAELAKRGIVGTLRLLDGRRGPIELEQFVPINPLPQLHQRSFVEATRFTIRHCRELLTVKLLLCKALWMYSLQQGHEYLVISSTQRLRAFYRMLLFEDLGAAGVYRHPTLGQSEHRTFILPVQTALERYRAVQHPLYEFMQQPQPNISLAPNNTRYN
ncbi:N-acyl amino acid synthase FeeM domain-containing protein [Herpetosiphon llansteffanensis]|uniref:N-acyl amino acid synthase FeeM domain-containing protein n=1 Tax=Herpetosiphon llansteffanensis TaxID=2094568 RepID=UPI000D7CF0B7|nr:hypothetical protein [Herpetosiphon llansteffanensis]